MDLFTYILAQKSCKREAEEKLVKFIERERVDDTFVLPDEVTKIGKGAFCQCDFVSLTLPKQLTSIGAQAFYNCKLLEDVTILNGLTISAQAFAYCNSLKRIYLATTDIPTLSHTNAFANVNSDCILIVPDSMYEEYEAAANWCTLSNIHTVSGAKDAGYINEDEYKLFLEAIS